jgi:hypothetical protein
MKPSMLVRETNSPPQGVFNGLSFKRLAFNTTKIVNLAHKKFVIIVIFFLTKKAGCGKMVFARVMDIFEKKR